MNKLASAILILVAFGCTVQSFAIHIMPSSKAFREYVATPEAGAGWIAEHDRCRIATKIAKDLATGKDIEYEYWYAASRHESQEAAKVSTEALL